MAEALHVLPYSGGLLEQPAGALFKMEAILMVIGQDNSAEGNRADAEARLKARTQK